MGLSKKYRKVLKALERGKDRDVIAQKHQVDRDQVDEIARQNGIDDKEGGR
jgi:hypothetical protein